MSIMLKKILRTMREHKSQYIGAIILIILSCMTFSVMNIMSVNMYSNLDEFKSSYIQEDAYFVLSSELENIEELENKYDLTLERRGSTDFSVDDSTTLRILSQTSKVDKHIVIRGNDLTKDDDLLIDPAFAKAHAINIGDELTVFNKTFNVSGFVSSPDYIYPLKNDMDMMKNPKAFGFAVITTNAFNQLNNGYWFYSVKYGDTDISAFKTELRTNQMILKWTDKKDNMRISFIEGDIKGLKPMGTVLPSAVLFITCVLVVVVLSRLLKREYSQIGVFYALGYTKGKILKHYLTFPFLMSTFGGIIGTLFGVLLVKPFYIMIANFYNLPLIYMDYKISTVLFSVIFPFILLVPVSLIVILRALKMSPVQLIHGGIKRTKPNFLEKNLNLGHFKFTTKFKVREIIRNIPRSFLVLLGVICASAFLLLGFVMKDSMDYLFEDGLLNTYGYSYIYSFNSLQTEEPEQGEKVNLAPFNIKFGEKDVAGIIYGIQPDASMIDLRNSDGLKLDYNSVIITRALADILDLSIGDEITIKNKITQQEDILKIDEIAQFFLGCLVYLPIDRFNTLTGYPYGSYIELESKEKLDIPSSDLISVTSKQYMLDSYNALLLPLKAMTGLIGFFAFLIGLIILYVVTSLIVEENRESICLMKVFGYNKKQLYSLLLNPYTIFVFVGFVLAVPVVMFSLDKFFVAMTKDMSMSIPIHIESLSVLWSFIVMIATYEMSKFLNRRKIKAINMSEGLKNKWE